MVGHRGAREAFGVYCSWSGGKDSALALHEVTQDGAEPRLLLTMMTEHAERSRSHGLRRSLLREQANAIGVPIIFGSATWDGYTVVFRKLVAQAVAQGWTHGVFGDIDSDTHREWVESVTGSAGSSAHLPLWRRRRPQVMKQLLQAGFEARIVAVRDGLLPRTLLGQPIDGPMLRRFERAGIDLAGEDGEYHTVVTAGPLFPQPLDVAFGEATLRDGVWFVDAWMATPVAPGPRQGPRSCQ